MSQKILVTGAGGFIGLNLANHLSVQGFDVTGLDLHYPDETADCRIHFQAILGDFRDVELMKQSLRNVDYVFHLASAHLNVNLEDSDYWDINVRSLPALLESVRKHEVQRFVHVSSVGIYGQLQSCPANEDTPCHPQSIYGQTKWEGEKVVREFAREKQFPVVVLRPTWVYGMGCPRTAKIYRALRKRRFPMIGSCTNLRHPVFIADFLQACELSMQCDVEYGDAFIIGGEKPITSRELIETYCTTCEVPRPLIRIPYRMGRLIAAAAETIFGAIGKEPPISRRTLEFFDTDNAFDIGKAQRHLGYQPKYRFDRGLSETKPWLINMT